MSTIRLVSTSEFETRQIGVALGQRVDAGDVVGICGELGAGKTTLVRGLAEGLGLRPEEVRSPSFTLVNEYRGGRLPLIHVDLYRAELGRLDVLCLRELLDGDGVSVVEWWDRMPGELASVLIQMKFAPDNARHIMISSDHAGWVYWMEQMSVVARWEARLTRSWL